MKGLLIGIAAVVLVAGVAAGAIFIATDDKETPNQTSQSSQTTETTTEQSTDNGARTSTVSVSISNFAFPKKIKVSRGTTVTWTNQDSAAHTVTSDTNSSLKGLDSPSLRKGESYSFTFDQIGIYSYHCTPHPDMQATVEVVEESVQEVIQ